MSTWMIPRGTARTLPAGSHADASHEEREEHHRAHRVAELQRHRERVVAGLASEVTRIFTTRKARVIGSTLLASCSRGEAGLRQRPRQLLGQRALDLHGRA